MDNTHYVSHMLATNLKMTQLNNCIYCKNEYQKDTEHVFPKGLGGQDIYVDFVCLPCNKAFSKLEGELIQKSILGLERSIQGVEGYKKKGKISPFKPTFLLTYDPTHQIVFEIGQHGEMKTYLLPQLIKIKDGYYIEADSNESLERFNKAIKKWKNNSLKMVEASAIREGGLVDSYLIVAPHSNDKTYLIKSVSENLKIKDEIRIDYLSEEHSLFSKLSPRLFLDERDPRNPRLKIRSKNKQQALTFITELLNRIDKNETFYPFPNKNLKEAVTYVSQTFDIRKFERAIVKIVLNCIMHYFPHSKKSVALKPILEYVSDGKTNIIAELGTKSELTDSDLNSHNLFFKQQKNNLSCRVSFFNGTVVYKLRIENLEIMKIDTFSRLVIDYKNRLNKFENHAETLISLANEKGC